MTRRIRPHFSYANVMATIALFVALGGGAYAAIKLPRNSVGTAELKSSAVTSAKVKNLSCFARSISTPASYPLVSRDRWACRDRRVIQESRAILEVRVILERQGRPARTAPTARTDRRTPRRRYSRSCCRWTARAQRSKPTSSTAWSRRPSSCAGATTACTGSDKVTAIGINGDVTCTADVTAPTGTAGGVLGGSYPSPTFATAVNALVPVTAFVFLGSTGALGNEAHRSPMSGAPAITRNGAGDYTVDFPGMTFISSVDVANCTPQDSTAFSVAVSSVNGSDLVVLRTFNAAGTATDPSRVHCTVYDVP